MYNMIMKTIEVKNWNNSTLNQMWRGSQQTHWWHTGIKCWCAPSGKLLLDDTFGSIWVGQSSSTVAVDIIISLFVFSFATILTCWAAWPLVSQSVRRGIRIISLVLMFGDVRVSYTLHTSFLRLDTWILGYYLSGNPSVMQKFLITPLRWGLRCFALSLLLSATLTSVRRNAGGRFILNVYINKQAVYFKCYWSNNVYSLIRCLGYKRLMLTMVWTRWLDHNPAHSPATHTHNAIHLTHGSCILLLMAWDSCSCMTWLLLLHDLTPAPAWPISCSCMTWHLHDLFPVPAWPDSSSCMTWLILQHYLFPAPAWPDSFSCMTWLLLLHDLTRPPALSDSDSSHLWVITTFLFYFLFYWRL